MTAHKYAKTLDYSCADTTQLEVEILFPYLKQIMLTELLRVTLYGQTKEGSKSAFGM